MNGICQLKHERCAPSVGQLPVAGISMVLSYCRRAALTLLEMMVAVTLLAVIMIGLLAMFNHTQKALHIVNTQTDVLENGRFAIEMISRDLAEMSFYPDTNVLSTYANAYASPVPGSALPLASGTMPVSFADAFWLSRANDDWRGIGYFVSDDSVQRSNYGVGTLYRFLTNAPGREGVQIDQVTSLSGWFTNAVVGAPSVRRVSDGVVHFAMTAVYVANIGAVTNPVVSFLRETNFAFPQSIDVVTTNSSGVASINTIMVPLPAFVDVELGVLEPATLKQFESLRNFDLASAKSFLTNHAEKIHFFRERVPIRNFVNPYRANELP